MRSDIAIYILQSLNSFSQFDNDFFFMFARYDGMIKNGVF